MGRPGYDLVLDKAEGAISQTSLLPYNSGRVVDLTQDIIAKLNASAPAPATRSSVPARFSFSHRQGYPTVIDPA